MKCPICDEDNSRPLVVDLEVCGSCNHVFKNCEVPKDFYTDYRSSAHIKATPLQVEQATRAATIRMNFLKGFSKSGRDKKLLELGPGHSYFLDMAVKDKYKVEGTELSEALISDIEHKIHLGNPSEIKKLKKYDVIAGFHVLEHFNYPLKEFRVLTEHLTDDGVMILEFPNMFFYGLELNPSDFYVGGHTQYFNPISFNIFVERCGLKQVLRTTYWDGKIGVTLVALIKDTSDVEKMKQHVIKNILAGED